jgi:hypothetical protein
MRMADFLTETPQPAAPAAKKRWPSEKQLLLRITQNVHKADDTIEQMLAAGAPVSEPVLIALVTAYGGFLRNAVLRHASDAVKLAAITVDGDAIGMILAPGPALQLAAVQQSISAIRRIHGPLSYAVMHYVLTNTNAGSLIQYMPDLPEDLQKLAAGKFYDALRYVAAPSAAAQVTACASFGLQGMESLLWDPKGQRRDIIVPEAVLAALDKDPLNVLDRFVKDAALPNDYQWAAFNANPQAYHKLKDRPDFDPAIAQAWKRWARRKGREYELPLLGKGPVTAGMNQDQLRLLRWMAQQHRDSISVRELKAQPWGNTPSLAALVRSGGGRDITRAMVQAYRDAPKTVASDIVRQAEIGVRPWTGLQRMFDDRPNLTAVYSATGEALRQALDLDSQEQGHLAAIGRGGHPTPPQKDTHQQNRSGLFLGGSDLSMHAPKFKPDARYALGWIRFTQFGKDVWIDEVQSDLLGSFSAPDTSERVDVLRPATATQIKDITEQILLDFLARMRRRGTQRFFMPSYDMKKADYAADPPQSIYKDLPRKMRFRMDTVQGIDPRVDGRPAWILEGAQRVSHTP